MRNPFHYCWTLKSKSVRSRCLITTIDHETAAKDPDEQPLKELRKYVYSEIPLY